MYSKKLILLFLLTKLFYLNLFGQNFLKTINFDPAETQFNREQVFTPFSIHSESSETLHEFEEVVRQATFLSLKEETHKALLNTRGNIIQVRIPISEEQLITLKLKEVNLFSREVRILRSSQKDRPIRSLNARYFWGVVKDQSNSIVSFSVLENEIMAFISYAGKNYTLGAIENDADNTHVIYQDSDLKVLNDFICHFNAEIHAIAPDDPTHSRSADSLNCVNVYVEVEKDIHDDKGSVSAASEYVLGAFSQVFILYANENINARVSEILVWDTPSPYDGPSSGDYLTQFRDELNGNFNGDIAHLVAYAASGGVAYLIQDICNNKYWNVAFSSISSSYQNFPNYSWTVMVLAHEMGHNLGSRHTHNCYWNGQGNDAIDGCGPQAGYSEGCDGPIPSDGGTIMSYCHLIGGVGINPSEGFGPQPGDHMRNHVYGAGCLTECPEEYDAGITGVIHPAVFSCNTDLEPIVILHNFGTNSLTSVDIKYSVNGGSTNTYEWTGNLSTGESEQVTLPLISFPEGIIDFYVYTENPNGEDDSNPNNDDYEYEFEVTESEHELLLTIKFDPWPEDISWELLDANGQLLFEGGDYDGLNNQTIEIPLCVDGDCFEFIIYDEFGDGLAGNSWQQGNEGFYLLTYPATADTFAFGDDFGFQDNTEFCLDDNLFEISGFLGSPFNEPLQQVEINIISDGEELEFESNGNGTYTLGLEGGSDNLVSFNREESDIQGLSTLDLIKIQQHLVSQQILDAPYGLIAADVNMDGKINTIDLILLQQYILGLRDEFPHGHFWRFIPADHVFSNPQNALEEGWPEGAEYNNLSQNYSDEDWTTIRIGDVNGDYFPSGQKWVRPALEIVSYLRSPLETEDDISQWSISVDSELKLNGFQIELDISEKMTSGEFYLNSNLPDFNEDNWYFDIEANALRIVWWSNNEVRVDENMPIFSILFNPPGSINRQGYDIVIKDQNQRFPTEFYGTDGTVYRPVLRSGEVYQTEDGQYSLYQNRPNPFSGETEIPFHLPNAQEVLLEVFDASGRLLKTFEFEGKEGMNFYLLQMNERWSGTHYYRLSTVNWESTRKMIISH